MHGRSRLLLAVAWSLSLLAAGPLTARADTQTAQLRMVDMADDANLDVYLDGARAWSNVGNKTISPYVQVSATSHLFEVRPAGADATSPPVGSARQDMSAGRFYTMWTAGMLHDDFRAAVFTDSSSPNPPPTFCVARFVHSSAAVPALDVLFQGPSARTQNIAFMHASDYVQMPAGIYDIQLRMAGTDQVIFTVKSFNADGGHIHSLAAVGGVNRRVEVIEMYDAASAAVTPQGAARTGEGGLVRASAYPVVPAIAIGLLMALLLPLLPGLAPRRAGVPQWRARRR